MHIVSTANINSCWDYGDEQSGTSCAAYRDHSYASPGTYSVRLTVDGPGGTDSMQRTSYLRVTGPSSGAIIGPVRALAVETGMARDAVVARLFRAQQNSQLKL